MGSMWLMPQVDAIVPIGDGTLGDIMTESLIASEMYMNGLSQIRAICGTDGFRVGERQGPVLGQSSGESSQLTRQ